MKALREGSTGDAVTNWQGFLRGKGFYWGKIDGDFGTVTDAATREYQRDRGLVPVDGVVGNNTCAAAMMQGFKVFESDNLDMTGPNWPLPPTNIRKITSKERAALLGRMTYKPAPVTGNPEAFTITNDWSKKHIVEVSIPQLKEINGILYRGRIIGRGPTHGRILLHKLFAEPLRATFYDWEKAGLLPHILTFDGLWVPRFIRGSRSIPSNHSYGSAIDINAPWNGFRCRPALVGHRGCIRELVPIANKNGIWWLGHTMDDGMHFSLGVET